ncbi:UDP-N-acetylmuramate dehydrogenase [Candidatus Kaiserbacteria bacterium]|nr:UDP-N-acetylmuramate dehydrogenase [Candidatus Kaiserbacteria bacterium]
MLQIQENVPLAPLTTFQIGGSAHYFFEAGTDNDIHRAVAWAQERKIPFVVISGGSNILFKDMGFDGLVIRIRTMDYAFDKGVLHVGAGCDLLTIIRLASERRLGGWEKLAGIPGSVGGAIRGNAGAFGSEIKDFITTIEAFNTHTHEMKTFLVSEVAFAYRTSFFKTHPEWIILRGSFVLKVTDVGEGETLIKATIAEREKRHLQSVKAAGSYFMNPVAPDAVRAQFEEEKKTVAREGRVPAGWLIEKAGMKGATEGGAQASEQHPNYIINTDNATAVDVLALAERIKLAVKEKFGVTLQEEAVRM